MCDTHEIQKEYNIDVLADDDQLQPAHAVILAVPHQYFMDKDWAYIIDLLKNKTGAVIDVKAKLERNNVPEGISLWRL
jgi:UDP-N-acetyl-D-galactosamine dehydrogenase